MTENQTKLVGRTFRHFKGNLYRLEGFAKDSETLEVLKNARRGVLSVIGDDGWPYGIHLNPYWEDGRLYFHGAKAGHKINEKYIEGEINNVGAYVQVFALLPEHITGKRVHEA